MSTYGIEARSQQRLPGFAASPNFGEQTLEETTPEGVRLLLNAPTPSQFDAKRPTLLIVYATPNGSAIEQAMGSALDIDKGVDARFDNQHIAAQTRRLREIDKGENIVLACVEAAGLSWPAWRQKHADNPVLIRALVESVRKRVPGAPVRMALTGHSGGGSFLFGFLNSVETIPAYVERIAFLDANYSYSEADKHGDKLLAWLKGNGKRHLITLAYDDRNITVDGKPVVGPDGGTYRATHRMLDTFAKTVPLMETVQGEFTRWEGMQGRSVFLIHNNPANKILHTALVGDMNGFLMAITQGTNEAATWGTFGGPRAYTDWIQPAAPPVKPTTPPTKPTDKPDKPAGVQEKSAALLDDFVYEDQQRSCVKANMIPVNLINPKPDAIILDATPATYRQLADDVEANLTQHVLAKWFPATLDSEHGGFYQNFREDWSRDPKNDKGLVYQSRLTWIAAQAAMRYPAQSVQYRDAALRGLDFLESKLWDKEHGGFFWALDENGQPERGGEKHVYGISFGIYAAVACYQATQEPRALALAKRAYEWLEIHAHDKRNGGYYEALTREGKPILAPAATPNAGQNDFIGTHYGYKSMNTHIHLLEALTALYHAWPDARVRTRLQEVFTLVRDRIVVEPGCMNLFYTPAWRPIPDHDSFGHDVETAFLLVEAAQELNRTQKVSQAEVNHAEPSHAEVNHAEANHAQENHARVDTAGVDTAQDAKTWRAARQLVDHALDYGWDETNGGFYDSGTAFGAPVVTDKIWWVEAEGLNALLLMHEKYGHETFRYWQAFQRQWQFIRQYQTDNRYGGWFAVVTRDGKPTPGHIKSDQWTEAYHQGRALLVVSATLRYLAESESPKK